MTACALGREEKIAQGGGVMGKGVERRDYWVMVLLSYAGLKGDRKSGEREKKSVENFRKHGL